ncbi:V8-like Glu-specific endopeptidase [Streptomyces sp. 1222.5]|uniref:trypsin-like serine peptidase n=1 Tax=unclassified Streptomyces TaxID=2593676 RepID=UPI000896CD02|nr:MULTISPECIES: trypsin-like peptidase domain-containing protein [unclassified Streptomyces]PKW08622.1 V8-like Glu-specific endopeptidase [Streptomyces sp. 5112.2]SEC58196.1 V8-like Glu-specific endopeptidase [Streptomyces sp. 1222.5]
MKRISRSSVTSRPALLGAVVLLALTSASVAAADDGPGPLGVTADAAVTRQSVRVGALFAADRADRLAGGHFCTASVVHSSRGDLIVTAAHCVDGPDVDLVFVPGYRDGRAPYGVWRVTRRFLPDGWAEGRDEDSDLAFATVAGPDGRHVEDVVGADRFATGTATGATAVTVTGYPDSREVPVRCTNKPAPHSRTQQRIDCPDLTGGTSGSPWVNGDGQVVGVLGGHEKGGATADVSYSVVLGGEAAELYRDASNAS